MRSQLCHRYCSFQPWVEGTEIWILTWLIWHCYRFANLAGRNKAGIKSAVGSCILSWRGGPPGKIHINIWSPAARWGFMPWVCFSFASPFLRTSCFLTSARYKSESCCPYDEPLSNYPNQQIYLYVLTFGLSTNPSPQTKRMLAFTESLESVRIREQILVISLTGLSFNVSVIGLKPHQSKV